jgi:nucleoid-associated protein YgaU
LWPRLFTANRDRINDPDLIQVGQVLRIPFEGP